MQPAVFYKPDVHTRVLNAPYGFIFSYSTQQRLNLA